ncbi:MAG: hypothetical protein ACKV2T_22155 [Kofleriaceae bacterium]
MLVHHTGKLKEIIDVIHIACANVESELALVLAPHMRRPREAKKLLAKERTLELLRGLGRGGHVVKRKEIPHPLFLALRVHFGTLANARRAAGIAQLPRTRTWSAERVINEIRALHRDGVVIRVADIDDAGSDGLVYALYRYVGSMKRARRLARVPDPPWRRFGDPWDEDRVIEEIKELHAAGESVAMIRVDRRLADAGRRFFGSWREAIEAAGLDYAKVRLVREAYTRKEVIVFPSAAAASAIADGLVHRGILVRITGKSKRSDQEVE